MTEPSSDAAEANRRLEIIHRQISKLSKITELIAEGTFFFYHPREEDVDDGSLSRLAENFNRMIARIQDHQQNLEEKVSQRTAELEASLTAIERLKQEQDGDYFLTSELLAPFGSNRSDNQFLDIELYTRQKKRFTYKHWNRSIGGDISGSSDIELAGRPFTFFFNADAMGKSIPGAGGALVLGAVAESIVQRTHISSSYSGKAPEIWLKEAFLEIVKVYEGFEGSTMITMIIGLVDHASGAMYWINADHPLPVLYRNGRATYLQTEFLYNKVGLKLYGGIMSRHSRPRPLTISTLRLRPGDVILCGSDGKDYLVLGEDEDGQRIINSDAGLFQRIVEKGDGRIDRILTGLEAQGQLMDDLSLLRLRFNGPGIRVMPMHREEEEIYGRYRSAATEEERETLRQDTHARLSDNAALILYKIAGQLEWRKGDPAAAAECPERYTRENPADSGAMHLFLNCCIKLGRRQEAVALGERLILRDPANIRLQLQVVSLYLRLDREKEGRRLLKNIDPHRITAEPIRKKFEELCQRLDLHLNTGATT